MTEYVISDDTLLFEAPDRHTAQLASLKTTPETRFTGAELVLGTNGIDHFIKTTIGGQTGFVLLVRTSRVETSPDTIAPEEVGLFRDLVIRTAERVNTDPTYLMAVAYDGTKNLKDLGIAGDGKVGPFQFTAQEWHAAITTGPAKDVDPPVPAEARFFWRSQPRVAALLAADLVKRLQTPAALNRLPTRLELYFAQLFGDGAEQVLKRPLTDLCKNAVTGTPAAGSYAAELAGSEQSIGDALDKLRTRLADALAATGMVKAEDTATHVGAATEGGSSFADKCRIFMPRLMDAFGLTDFQAAGVFGNLGRETGGFRFFHELGQPEDHGGYGWAQWTGSRRENFFKWCDDNNLKREGDEASFGFLCFEFKGDFQHALTDLKAAEDIKAATDMFESEFEIASVVAMDDRLDWAQKALTALKSAPEEPANSNLTAPAETASGDFYIALNPERFMGQCVGDGECVTYVHEACKPVTLPPTHQWQKGRAAKGTNLPSGTIIATFRGANGGYNTADGLQHAAVLLEEKQDGLLVLDQFNAHGGQPGQAVDKRTLHFGASSPVNDGDQFFAIKKA
ncbi:MAG TPA: phage tail tip lysozyme [Acetobacteraceae bacterium]|nr:phage tail tip lysozyme [Acetobacteraceae bacterium]